MSQEQDIKKDQPVTGEQEGHFEKQKPYPKGKKGKQTGVKKVEKQQQPKSKYFPAS